MKIKQKLLYAILGFLVGNAHLLSLFFGYKNLNSPTSNADEISLDQALTKIKNNSMK